ncbi:hypothetical protein BC833DRAFT_563340 [Globomyces pollinis-pini]|nr:hypothetical protein BC833DRAFT_563340 [Globomyces pollinis-pini]
MGVVMVVFDPVSGMRIDYDWVYQLDNVAPIAHWNINSLDVEASEKTLQFSANLIDPMALSMNDFNLLTNELNEIALPFNDEMNSFRGKIKTTTCLMMGCFFCTCGLSACVGMVSLSTMKKHLPEIWSSFQSQVNTFVAFRNQSLSQSGLLLIFTNGMVGTQTTYTTTKNGTTSSSVAVNEYNVVLVRCQTGVQQPTSILAPAMAHH